MRPRRINEIGAWSARRCRDFIDAHGYTRPMDDCDDIDAWQGRTAEVYAETAPGDAFLLYLEERIFGELPFASLDMEEL